MGTGTGLVAIRFSRAWVAGKGLIFVVGTAIRKGGNNLSCICT
jgi:hypothetical protein